MVVGMPPLKPEESKMENRADLPRNSDVLSIPVENRPVCAPNSRPEIADSRRIRMGDCMAFTFGRPTLSAKR